MRSARMILATAAASAVLALGAPGAYASDWDPSSKGENSSSYGKEHDKHDKHDKHGKHDWPHGGVKAGGGALTSVGADDWSKENGDKGYGKDGHGKDGHGKDGYGKDWKDKHDKPHGGVHTGGGGLSEPSVTAGGLAVLGVAAAGLFAARRRKTAGSVA
ncbi:hypothetical protein [Streptomyces sp. NBC_00286]|uniref:hypothetical protein n=1 Tax=Streptomyces sp. NBC_00286 TaxID=2975701 RepID=UPI002E2E15D7|nr:hypothetical protein [Streptomyces sp. NBC_00286]